MLTSPDISCSVLLLLFPISLLFYLSIVFLQLSEIDDTVHACMFKVYGGCGVGYGGTWGGKD